MRAADDFHAARHSSSDARADLRADLYPVGAGLDLSDDQRPEQALFLCQMREYSVKIKKWKYLSKTVVGYRKSTPQIFNKNKKSGSKSRSFFY
jgi:hypothetical protein